MLKAMLIGLIATAAVFLIGAATYLGLCWLTSNLLVTEKQQAIAATLFFIWLIFSVIAWMED